MGKGCTSFFRNNEDELVQLLDRGEFEELKNTVEKIEKALGKVPVTHFDRLFTRADGLATSFKGAELDILQGVRWNLQDDILDIFVHAKEGKYIAYIESTGDGLIPVVLGEKNLASLIAQIPGNEGKAVRLLSCSDLESAKEFSKALNNRPVYATEDLVEVYTDGGITTVARSGNSTQKWRKLQNGEDVGEGPTPIPPKSEELEFVRMGEQSALPTKIEAKIKDFTPGQRKAFLEDYADETFRGAINEKPELVDAWEVLSISSEFRKSPEALRKVHDYAQNPDNFTSFKIMSSDFKAVKDKKKWLDELEDNDDVVIAIGGNDISLITSSNPKRQHRITTAANFLKKMGKNNEQINSILNFVDLSKGVSVTPLKKGNKVWRYERVGDGVTIKEKHFFTDAQGADAGVRAVGFQDPSGYELVTYEVIKTTNVLNTKIKNVGNNQFISGELQYNIKEISRVKATH